LRRPGGDIGFGAGDAWRSCRTSAWGSGKGTPGVLKPFHAGAVRLSRGATPLSGCRKIVLPISPD